MMSDPRTDPPAGGSDGDDPHSGDAHPRGASIFVCPECRGEIAPHEDGLLCRRCARRYPLIDHVPWLLPDPEAALWDWKNQLIAHLQTLDVGVRLLRRELD